MAVKVDIRELRKFKEQLEKIDEQAMQEFSEETVKELAARLLRKVVQLTPVGKTQFTAKRDNTGKVMKYTKGKRKGEVKQSVSHTGGELRRNWQIGSVHYYGGTYVIEVINQTEYASYVEDGHRQTPGRYVPAIGKRLKAGWVEGRHMLRISENELKEDADGMIAKKLQGYLNRIVRRFFCWRK